MTRFFSRSVYIRIDPVSKDSLFKTSTCQSLDDKTKWNIMLSRR